MTVGEGNHRKPIHLAVQSDACDGFILAALGQERGVLRTEYDGMTLREHLGP